MKRFLPFLFLAVLGTGYLFGALFFYPLEVKLPYVQRFFLPHAPNRDTPIVPADDKPFSASILFTGDVMMARDVEGYIAANGKSWPFAKLGNTLKGADLVVGNFEGTIRDEQTIEGTNSFSFDTTPDNVQILKDAGFDVLSLANNHADDFGPAVTQYTRETIETYGIDTFGDAVESKNFIAHETVNGMKFAFIGFHAFGEDAESLIDTIKAEDAAGNFVIMFSHWGVEYERDPYIAEVTAAHLFIDAGADAVIGAHPHVIQTTEIYKNVPIVYSLGNFLFDQSWSVPTKIGLTAKMTVTDDAVTINFTPVYINQRQTMPADEATKKSALEALGLPDGSLTVKRN
jgi:poly-gamma-glutamate synthesis protein (capsule biosynthesis protein)